MGKGAGDRQQAGNSRSGWMRNRGTVNDDPDSNYEWRGNGEKVTIATISAIQRGCQFLQTSRSLINRLLAWMSSPTTLLRTNQCWLFFA